MRGNGRYAIVFSLFSACGAHLYRAMGVQVGRGLKPIPGFACTLSLEEGKGEEAVWFWRHPIKIST